MLSWLLDTPHLAITARHARPDSEGYTPADLAELLKVLPTPYSPAHHASNHAPIHPRRPIERYLISSVIITNAPHATSSLRARRVPSSRAVSPARATTLNPAPSSPHSSHRPPAPPCAPSICPTMATLSQYLAAHLSTHEFSPTFRSPSLNFLSMHFS